MYYVYDYMFHLLNEYSKLLKFKLAIPKEAIELCSEAMACHATGKAKQYMNRSLVKNPATIAPPYEPKVFKRIITLNLNQIK